MKHFSIEKDFGEYTMGRYRSDSDFSGERLRDDYLIPLINSLEINETLVINTNGRYGHGSSFLHETFAYLYRNLEAHQRPKIHNIQIEGEYSIELEIGMYLQVRT